MISVTLFALPAIDFALSSLGAPTLPNSQLRKESLMKLKTKTRVGRLSANHNAVKR